MNLVIPENIKVDWFPSIYSMRYCYIIHKILQEQYFQKVSNETYVNLNSVILKAYIGVKYTELIRELVKQGIIETDGLAIQGYKSKGYRLTERYRGARVKWIELTDQKLKARLKVFLDTSRIMSELEWLQKPLKDLSMDDKRATEFINDTYSGEVNKYNSRDIAIHNTKENPLNPFLQDNKGGRVYTSLSLMPKDLRPFCSVKGEPLVSIDISCSQPYHFIALAKTFTRENVNPEYTYTNVYGEEAENDLELYEYLACNNELYDYFIERMNFTGTKREFKDLFFAQVWYCDNPKNYHNEMQMFMDSEFPTISKALKHYKKNTQGFYTDSGDKFKNFPILLQHIEKNNVVDKIAKSLITNNPAIFIATIHDAIITTQGNESKVLNEMNKVFYNQYQNTPTIKTELLIN